jgi:hypothetical protein
MPTFSTPEPIVVSLELAAGDAHISAGDSGETVVEAAPRDPSRRADVRAAEELRVEYADGRLLVRSPRQGFSLARNGTVDVTLTVPAGSRLEGHTGAGHLRADGALADCVFKSGAGRIEIGDAGAVRLVSGAGDISVGRASGTIVATTGSGSVRIAAAERDIRIKSGNGSAEIGAAGADVGAVSGNGDITIGSAARNVSAKTGNGNLRVAEATSGSVELSTGKGDIEIGIAAETAARLDVRTQFGRVDQQLEPTGAPPASTRTVSVRGRTGFGDITIRRAVPR